jgi:hypothetical protein
MANGKQLLQTLLLKAFQKYQISAATKSLNSEQNTMGISWESPLSA